MELICNQCGTPIPAADVNLEKLVAKCPRCNSVFSFADQLSRGPSIAAAMLRQKPVATMPKSVKVREEPTELRIEMRWFSPKYVALAIFCVFWDGFLIMWYGAAIAKRQWVMAAFPTLHALVGFGLTYATIASFLNTTYIRVGARGFDVRHGPIKMPGINRVVPSGIEQVYCKEKITRGKNGPNYSYEVYARTNAGKDEKIVGGLENSNQARFLEQAIEKYLKIEDKPVPGEMLG